MFLRDPTAAYLDGDVVGLVALIPSQVGLARRLRIVEYGQSQGHFAAAVSGRELMPSLGWDAHSVLVGTLVISKDVICRNVKPAAATVGRFPRVTAAMDGWRASAVCIDYRRTTSTRGHLGPDQFRLRWYGKWMRPTAGRIRYCRVVFHWGEGNAWFWKLDGPVGAWCGGRIG